MYLVLNCGRRTGAATNIGLTLSDPVDPALGVELGNQLWKCQREKRREWHLGCVDRLAGTCRWVSTWLVGWSMGLQMGLVRYVTVGAGEGPIDCTAVDSGTVA
jgi:hypothetical protein